MGLLHEQGRQLIQKKKEGRQLCVVYMVSGVNVSNIFVPQICILLAILTTNLRKMDGRT